MNQLPMFDEPAKDLRDEIIGRLTLQLEEEKDFTLKLVPGEVCLWAPPLPTVLDEQMITHHPARRGR